MSKLNKMLDTNKKHLMDLLPNYIELFRFSNHSVVLSHFSFDYLNMKKKYCIVVCALCKDRSYPYLFYLQYKFTKQKKNRNKYRNEHIHTQITKKTKTK